jgi:hypothetical protein
MSSERVDPSILSLDAGIDRCSQFVEDIIKHLEQFAHCAALTRQRIGGDRHEDPKVLWEPVDGGRQGQGAAEQERGASNDK